MVLHHEVLYAMLGFPGQVIVVEDACSRRDPRAEPDRLSPTERRPYELLAEPFSANRRRLAPISADQRCSLPVGAGQRW